MEGELSLTEPAKLLLLASILAKDRMITLNGKAFFKVSILSDPKVFGICWPHAALRLLRRPCPADPPAHHPLASGRN